MCKFQDFFSIQILREINCRASKGSKTAIFAILESLNFVDMQEFIKLKIQILSICFADFEPLSDNFDFT